MECQTVYPDTASISRLNAGILTTANVLVLLFNLTTNCLMLYSIRKRRLLQAISYQFIFALIICDLCVALLAQPLVVASLYLKKDNNNLVNGPHCILRLTAEFFAFLLCECSGIFVMNIGLDRYLHMKHLQNYNKYMTPFRAKALIISSVVFSCVIATIFVISSLYGFLFIYHTIVLLIDLPVIISNFIFYARAYLSIRKKVLQLELNAKNSSGERADLLFAKAVTLIVVCTIVCYSPYFVLQTAWGYLKHFKKGNPSKSLSVAVYWSILFIHISSLCNPIILINSNSETNTMVKDLLNGFFGRNKRELELSGVVKSSGYGSTASLSNVATLNIVTESKQNDS